METFSIRSNSACESATYLPRSCIIDRELMEAIRKIDARQIDLISFDIATEILSNVLGLDKALIQKDFLNGKEQSPQKTIIEEQGQVRCLRKFHWFVESLPHQTNAYFSKQFSNPSHFMLFGIIFSVFINHVTYVVSIRLDRRLSQEHGKLVFSVSDSCEKITYPRRIFTIKGLEEERSSVLSSLKCELPPDGI